MAAMAIAHRHADAVLTGRSARDLARAEFFQTVREILVAAGRSVGDDTRAAGEPMRFHVADGMRHPDTEIVALAQPAAEAAVEMTVGHMGLSGPMGVLPDHYSDLLVERRRARDDGLARFLDLFNHRAISLFYRAWAKYRLPVRFEEDGGNYADPFSNALAAIAGIVRLDDPGLLGAAGALSRRVRSPASLKRVVGAMFAMPIDVIELRPRWIRIAPEERTRLGSRHTPAGTFAALGVNGVLGQAACDVTGRFRLRVGPLDRVTFEDFFAADGVRRRLVEAVRFAVGGAADFDIQLVLRADAVRPTRLGGGEGAMLSRSGWLLAATSSRDRDDAVLPGTA